MFKRCLLTTALLVLSVSGAGAQSDPVSLCQQAQQIAALDEPAAFQTPENLLKLGACLGNKDPKVRDEFAYEAFVATLRQGQTSTEALRILTAKLTANLKDSNADGPGFLAPFSALVLAEVARVDRLNGYMTRAERSSLVEAGTEYLQRIDDYRGFDPEQGWRHGVAHAADLMMQLALNPALEKADARRILDAVSAQVVPKKSHFYIYGEPGRLARPVIFLAATDLIAEEEWAGWFSALAATEDDPRWQDPYASVTGLARIHNTESFASAVFVRASAGANPALAPIAEASMAVLRSMP